MLMLEYWLQQNPTTGTVYSHAGYYISEDKMNLIPIKKENDKRKGIKKDGMQLGKLCKGIKIHGMKITI